MKPQIFNVWQMVDDKATVTGQTAFEHVEIVNIFDMWEGLPYRDGEPHEFGVDILIDGIRFLLVVKEGCNRPIIDCMEGDWTTWLEPAPSDAVLDPTLFRSVRSLVRKEEK